MRSKPARRAPKQRKTEKIDMQVKLFVLPVFADKDCVEELNLFLRSNRVLEIKKDFVNAPSGQYWAFCVTYLPMGSHQMPVTERREKVDYRNVLSEVEFERFSALRKIRKRIADDDAVPPYAVFTDAELSEIARFEEVTPDLLLKIGGIGKRKVEKYGNEMCRLLSEGKCSILSNEEGRESEGENC